MMMPGIPMTFRKAPGIWRHGRKPKTWQVGTKSRSFSGLMTSIFCGLIHLPVVMIFGLSMIVHDLDYSDIIVIL